LNVFVVLLLILKENSHEKISKLQRIMKRIFYENEKKSESHKNENYLNEIYIYNSNEQKGISEALNQIKNGQFLTNKKTNKEIKK